MVRSDVLVADQLGEMPRDAFGLQSMFARAGLVGADGPTHHGIYDMALLATDDRKPVTEMLASAELLAGKRVTAFRCIMIAHPLMNE